MRGNKLFSKIALVLTILCVAVVSVVFLPNKNIEEVLAEDTTKYKVEGVVSQKYDDDVIFSAEHVYYAEDRTQPIYYTQDVETMTSNILGYSEITDKVNNTTVYDEDNYFANYYGAKGNVNKKLIYDGDYVMVSETDVKNAYTYDSESGSFSTVDLNQGIMLTLGGYISETGESGTTTIYTNSEKTTDDKNYSASLQYAKMYVKHYDSNGKAETVPTAERTYNQGLNFDVVCFIPAKLENEGYYEVSVEYIKEGGSSQVHSFSFFMLMDDSYEKNVTINGNDYSVNPTFNIDEENDKYSSTTSGKALTITADGETETLYDGVSQYPAITYDYKHYDLSYKYTVNDSVYNVKVLFEQDTKNLVMTTNGKNEQTFSCENSNNIVTLLFASRGDYVFTFDYVYYYKDEKLDVNFKDITMNLSITGYELKYAKTGYSSSDFRNLTIAKNGTTIIPVNGYKNDNIPSSYDYSDLGYMYTFDKTSTYPTGTITKIEDGDVTRIVEEENLVAVVEDTGTEDTTKETSKISISDVGGKKNVKLSNFAFHNTDQTGLRFETNDLYNLSGSYYLYNQTEFKDGVGYSATSMTKVTTFSKVGYYIVKLGYKTSSSSTDTYYQWFAFRITSSTANLKLYAVGENGIIDTNETTQDDVRLYSNQYTNQDVYANWEESTTFESSQTVKLIKPRTSSNRYQSKQSLMNFADGGANVNLQSVTYTKNEVITESGSYLLAVSIDGKQSKAYYYFTIDKDEISGIEVLGLDSASVGTKSVYMVKQDASNNPITYTSNAFLNEMFTMWWNDKESGAKITATYTYTPFAYNLNDEAPLNNTVNGKNNSIVFTDYTIGSTSREIVIEKPTTKTSMVNAENVLFKSGIYWFTIKDEAGNFKNYAVIYDDTPIKINAKSFVYDKDGTSKVYNNDVELVQGDTISTNVEFTWGSHKGISLDKIGVNSNEATGVWACFYKLLENSDNYYQSGSSNYEELSISLGKQTSVDGYRLYLAVANNYATIESSNGTLKLNNNGTVSGTNSFVEIDSSNPYTLDVKIDKEAIEYILKVYGANIVDSEKTDYFKITLNPDNSKGSVYFSELSNSNNTDRISEFPDENSVKLYNTDATNEDDFELSNIFNNSQASNGISYVFEWLAGTGTEFEVAKVSYEYHPLMSQEELNDFAGSKYFPYSENGKTVVIYDNDNNIQDYTTITRDGNVYCSSTLNVGYVIYYNENHELINATGTLPGLYIITREYTKDTGSEVDAHIRKYAFIIDRNQVIDYSTSNASEKTVGEYINLLAQNSKFDTFTQGVTNYNYTIDNTTYTNAQIYLQSNKLPLTIKVPTGKYASYNSESKSLTKTSYSNTGKLTFSLIFVDSNNYLGQNTTGEVGAMSFYLFKDREVEETKGYITYSLSQENIEAENVWWKEYLKACNQTGNEWLSLPGYYFLVIKDNVGDDYKDNSITEIADPNEIRIGVEITAKSPVADFYNGQKVDSETKVEFNENELTTSKAYVKYTLPKIEENSFDAIIDTSYIYITRETLENGKVTSESQVYYNSINSTNNDVITNSGMKFTPYEGGKQVEYIKTNEDGSKTIWLETGLEFDENGQIKNYAEYRYTIKVRYILGTANEWENCYIYTTSSGEKQNYYETIYTVEIDRTALLDNLEEILTESQKAFFEDYYNYFSNAEYVSLQDGNLLNKLGENLYETVAFKGNDEEYYFGIVNKLFYYYVSQGDYDNAENSMYAIAVDSTDDIKTNGKVYYRQLYARTELADGSMYVDNSNNKHRMALLPISSDYFGMNSSEFSTFNIGDTKEFTQLTSYKWKDLGSGYYEIIEIDEANNFVQYIVYVVNDNTSNEVELTFKDTIDSYKVNFDFDTNEIKINGEAKSDLFLILLEDISDMFESIKNLSDGSNYTANDWYYKLALKEVSLTNCLYYYVNSNNLDVASFLLKNIKEKVNYELIITNRYNESLTLGFLNADSNNYSLDYNGIQPLNDGDKYYILPSRLNTKWQYSDTSNFTYYVTEIELYNKNKGETITYKFNSLGQLLYGENGDKVFVGTEDTNVIDEIYEIYKAKYVNVNGENVLRIDLETDATYVATIQDIAGKEKKIQIYAYDATESQNDYIEFEKNTSKQDVYYTAGEVYIKYKSDSVAFPTIDIYIWNEQTGDYEFKGNFNDGKSYSYSGKEIITDSEFSESYREIKFYPHSQSNGLKMRFEVTFTYGDETQNTYIFVIDNRVNSLQVVNAFDEDKTNIIKTKSEAIKDEENSSVYVSESDIVSTLYSVNPDITLSETIILKWNKLSYLVNDYLYYNAKLKLIKFESATDYQIVEEDLLASRPAGTYTISPKENELGRYVVLLTLTSTNNQIVYYKAYAFNISLTSSALYEVKTNEDEEILSESYIKGEELLACFTAELQQNIRNELGLTGDENSRFNSLNIPVFVTNKEFRINLSGSNVNRQCVPIENLGGSGYNLYIYKISNIAYTTYCCVLKAVETKELFNGSYEELTFTEINSTTPKDLSVSSSLVFTNSGTLKLHNFNRGDLTSGNENYLPIISKNTLYLEIYYRVSNNEKKYLGKFDDELMVSEYYSSLEFLKTGSYEIYIKDISGNTRYWSDGADHLTLTIIPEVLITVNGNAPIDYAYFNDVVRIEVPFNNSLYYHGTVTIKAYLNGSDTEYLTSQGGRKTNITSWAEFMHYGTYRVEIEAKYDDIITLSKTYIFSIINPNEARIGLDFTTINNYNITKVVNNTTGEEVTSTFKFLLNEAYIYSKLITYDRLASNEAFGATMGKQQFEVFYDVQENELMPIRSSSFKFTINNQTPALESSLTPGKSTTKTITIKFNPQTIYRQVGDCFIQVNGSTVYEINSSTNVDDVLTFQLKDVDVYYVRIINASNRVMASFKVTIKEPLNTWSIVLIVGVVLLVVGVIVTFIILRTKMKVR